MASAGRIWRPATAAREGLESRMQVGGETEDVLLGAVLERVLTIMTVTAQTP